jgi:hypothetical protein
MLLPVITGLFLGYGKVFARCTDYQYKGISVTKMLISRKIAICFGFPPKPSSVVKKVHENQPCSC